MPAKVRGADMLKHRKIGDADLYLVCEFSGPTHDRSWMLPDSTFEQMLGIRDLVENRFWLPLTDRLVFTMQLVVIKCASRVIVIDTGVGNFKSRKPGWQAMHNTPTLDWLSGIGAGREQVTDVVMTHLHGDHIGWNTLNEGYGWEPTFSKATYHIPALDYEAFKVRFDEDEALFDGGFADSVMPIVNAGMVQWFRPGDSPAGLLEAFDAAGHSPGQSGLVFRHSGETLIFCADVFHSPLQVYHPSINSRWCELPELARATRAHVMEWAVAEDARIMPAHSFAIEGWNLRRVEDRYEVDIGN